MLRLCGPVVASLASVDRSPVLLQSALPWSTYLILQGLERLHTLHSQMGHFLDFFKFGGHLHAVVPPSVHQHLAPASKPQASIRFSLGTFSGWAWK